MGKKIHRIHRGNDSWIKDIKVLTCILRLRCQPPCSYYNLAQLFLHVWPVPMLRLAGFRISAARDLPPDLDLEKIEGQFMNDILPRIFTTCEDEEEEAWKAGKQWDDATVRRILWLLGTEEAGYEFAGEREMNLQILWRRTDDFKAGSMPMTINHGDYHGSLREYEPKPVPGQKSLLSISPDHPLIAAPVESGKATIRLLRLGPHPHTTRRGIRRTLDAQRFPFARQDAEMRIASSSVEDSAIPETPTTTTGMTSGTEMLTIREE